MLFLSPCIINLSDQRLVVLQQNQALLFRAVSSVMQVTFTADEKLNAHLECIKHVTDMGPNFLKVSYPRVCLGKISCLSEHINVNKM